MKAKNGFHINCKGQTTTNEYRRWVFSHMPAAGRLLDDLDSGSVPDWFAVWSALSEAVEYLTTRDIDSAQQEPFSCPGNCRVCSNC